MKVKIKKKLVFIDDGALNDNADVYKIGNIKLQKNPLPILYNFNPKFIIGEGFITRDKDNVQNIYADMILKPKTMEDAEKVLNYFTGTFPAIRGILLPNEQNKKQVDGLEIQGISICTQPNSDPRVQPILKDDMEIIEDNKPEKEE